jgi:hypothetical protein
MISSVTNKGLPLCNCNRQNSCHGPQLLGRKLNHRPKSNINFGQGEVQNYLQVFHQKQPALKQNPNTSF